MSNDPHKKLIEVALPPEAINEASACAGLPGVDMVVPVAG